MTEPDFLSLEDVLWIHEQQLELYGGQAGLRDPGLLESAIGMPRQTFGGDFVHEDHFAMAAAFEAQSQRVGRGATGVAPFA